MLVGFFLASLVIHGGCQKWWIAPVLSGLTNGRLMIGAIVLTAFNDNAAITYLASLVPGFPPSLKYAVVAGAVTGGGLTVIANAPNPAGQSILAPSFGKDGISPWGTCARGGCPDDHYGRGVHVIAVVNRLPACIGRHRGRAPTSSTTSAPASTPHPTRAKYRLEAYTTLHRGSAAMGTRTCLQSAFASWPNCPESNVA